VAAEVPYVVTFDLFSALIDSRSGAGAAFDRLAARRGWRVGGVEIYDAWDRRNKQAQRDCREWVSYVVLARAALARTYDALGLDGDAGADVDRVLDTLPEWPLWPDVEPALPELGRRHRVGLLSNVDDELFARTRAARYVDPALAMTSERLGVYKPAPGIYDKVRATLGPMVHVATSARDVRGSLEAQIPVVRLRRPGHQLDPEGPRPPLEATTIADLERLLPEARATAADG
jgi:2-haloacid dehalogenase